LKTNKKLKYKTMHKTNNDLYTEKELIHQVSANQVKRLT
jgi:hypothetical protein